MFPWLSFWTDIMLDRSHVYTLHALRKAGSVGQQVIFSLVRAVKEHQSSCGIVVVACARMCTGGSTRKRPTHPVIGFIARNASILLLDPPQHSPSR